MNFIYMSLTSWDLQIILCSFFVRIHNFSSLWSKKWCATCEDAMFSSVVFTQGGSGLCPDRRITALSYAQWCIIVGKEKHNVHIWGHRISREYFVGFEVIKSPNMTTQSANFLMSAKRFVQFILSLDHIAMIKYCFVC